MAVALGTNAGFVEVAPSADPDTPTRWTVDNRSSVVRDTSPATAIRITEVGFWADDASQESNFELGLYAADGVSVPGEAGTLLNVTRTNAKGTTAGWKRVTVDWEISADTTYWIGLQVDNTASITRTNQASLGGSGIDYNTGTGATTLPSPFGGGNIYQEEGMFTIYAVWDAGAPAGFTRKIKIAGTFEDKPIKTKVSGSFQDKVIKIKVGGTFQDA